MKKRITFIVLCMLMAGTMFSVTAFANDVSSGQDRVKATVVENEMAANADETMKSTPVTWTPSGIDLRERGIVTPVKSQNPWDTCWSFGAIAAMETSILSMENKTYEDTGLDLSERHLIYFAQTPITKETDESQAGEGISIIGKENDPNGPYLPAEPIVISSLLSSGVGPMDEASFPYQGKEGFTEYQYMLNNKEKWKNNYIAQVKREYGLKDDDEEISDKKVEEVYQVSFSDYEKSDIYSAKDDWSLPPEDRNLTLGYTLIDGNNLPPFFKQDEKWNWIGLNQEGIDAVKKELAAGRGVAATVRADLSSVGSNNGNTYMNTDTWAHYTFKRKSINHSVCIVGYDDNYPKENFTHTVYKRDAYGFIEEDGSGNPIPDEEQTALTTPPGNGAWIVKNSWGSETDWYNNKDGRPINKGAWGLVNEEGKHTGYFYISYYDKSINQPESYRFAKDLDADYFDVYQYDYMPAVEQFLEYTKKTKVAAANVYEIEEAEKMTSVGVRTLDSKQKTEFSIYKLNPNAKDPTDGTFLGKYSVESEYAGFHRIALSEPIHFEKGDKFSIVSETLGKNDEGESIYQVAANIAKPERLSPGGTEYCKAVVNPGESFIYDNSSWHDWSEYMNSDEVMKEVVEKKMKYYSHPSIDNFTLKAFFLPEGTSEKIDDPSDNEAELIEPGEEAGKRQNAITNVKTQYTKTLNFSKKSQKVLKLSPKAKGSARISFKITSMKKGSKKIRAGFTVTSKGTVKTVKKLARGKYTVKVKIRSAATKEYKAKTKTVTLKVKIK